MTTLEQAAEIVIKECLAVKKGEKVLIITDDNLKKIGEDLYKAALTITEAEILIIPVGKRNGEEPPAEVAKKMREYDVIIIPTTVSLTHTKAVREATNARVATMPSVNEEMMLRAIDVDYDSMAKRTNQLKDILNKGKKVKVVSDVGTELTFSIDEREAEGSAGILKTKGLFGNLPSGEAFIAPVEGTADGKIIIDGSVLNKKVDKIINVIVEDGFAVRIDDKELNNVLKSINDKNAFNIAEFGIGTNDKARVSGNVLEDEKVMGTCHFAFGNNKSFGGNTDVPVHIDGILRNPTVWVDDKKIIENGLFLF